MVCLENEKEIQHILFFVLIIWSPFLVKHQ